jgi:hypothetical protein
MTLFASLDAKDRKLLLACLVTVLVLAVLTGVLAGNQNRDNSPPSSYLSGRHGAKAAYELLQQSGYNPQRWEQPLTDLAASATAQTVVIFAEPFPTSTDDFKAVGEILKRGGRILVTGPMGGLLAPGGAVGPSQQTEIGACKLTPQGLDALAGSGEAWMIPAAGWQLSNPRYRVQYTCAGSPAVVEYDHDSGHVVWWASSTPLENGSISRAGNMDLFLNALGERAGHQFYWDESLHGETRSQWFYARGPAMNLLLIGLGGLVLVTLFSFSRRSGPVRDVPQPARTTPVEFLEALGSLYGRAGASATAVKLAYDRFRGTMGAFCGMEGMRMSAEEMSAALRRRFPKADEELEKDLKACEEGAANEGLTPRQALALVQKLEHHREALEAPAHLGKSKR